MSNNEYPGHAIPKPVIIGSYFALLFLAAVMIGLSRLDVASLGIDWMDLHALKTCIIMCVALVMGIIVSMFLMGLRYESKLLNMTIFFSNFVFLFIFVLFTWVDTSFRGEVDPTFKEKINFTSPVKAEEAAHEGKEAAPIAQPAPEKAAGAAPVDSSKEAKPMAPSAAPASSPVAPAKAVPAPVQPAPTPAH